MGNAYKRGSFRGFFVPLDPRRGAADCGEYGEVGSKKDAGRSLRSAADVQDSVRGLDVIPLALRTSIKSKCALRRFSSRGTGRFIWIVADLTARLWAIAIFPGSVRLL
jgi:hypothetical protein